jgi:hypothetical protein
MPSGLFKADIGGTGDLVNSRLAMFNNCANCFQRVIECYGAQSVVSKRLDGLTTSKVANPLSHNATIAT